MALSVLVVLCIGNFLGAFIKGITGFGSAIINLCVWITATCAGFNPGSLQQAVLTECIASEVLAIPLLCMTRAHVTCDWALVLSLSLFGALGAPVGAAMLTHLPVRQVEFAVGCLMLLVILVNCRQRRPVAQDKDMGDGCSNLAAAAAKPSTAWGGLSCQVSSPSKLGCVPCCDLELAASAPQLAVSSSTGHTTCMKDVTALVAVDCCPFTDADAGEPSGCSRHASSSSSSSLASEVQCICIISSAEHGCATSQTDLEHEALLPPSDPVEAQCTKGMAHITAGDITAGAAHCKTSATAPASAASRSCWACAADGVKSWWAQHTQPDRLLALRQMLLMGSLAGSASGVMAGLTGMGGPPVMLMFEKLAVPKDTVRGTNAVCNVIQVRIFAYMAMGVFSRADVNLYIAVSVCAVVGMLLGCIAAARTNQAAFSRMLTSLMVLCCVLMFASAAGIAGDRMAVQHSQA